MSLQADLSVAANPAHSFFNVTQMDKRGTTPILALSWAVSGQNLEVVVASPTNGYIAIGFQDPLKASSWMDQGEAIMGWFDTNGSPVIDAYFMDGYQVSDMKVLPNYISNATLTHVNGILQLSFVRPLAPSQANTIPLNPSSVGWQWATHTQASLSHHRNDGVFISNLLTGDISQPAGTDMVPWVVVAVFFIVSFVIGLVLNWSSWKNKKSVRRFLLRKIGRPREMTAGPGDLIRFCLDMAPGQALMWWGLILTLGLFTGLQVVGGSSLAKSLGWTSTLCMGLATLPVNKTSIWIWVFGIPFERAVAIHRAFSQTTLLILMLHSIVEVSQLGFGIVWQEKYSSYIYPLYGTIAAWCVMLMFLFSLFRRRFYRLFIKTHIFLLIPAYVFAALHVQETFHKVLLLSPLALYALDKGLRWSRKLNTATVVEAQNVCDDIYELQVKLDDMIDFEPGGETSN